MLSRNIRTRAFRGPSVSGSGGGTLRGRRRRERSRARGDVTSVRARKRTGARAVAAGQRGGTALAAPFAGARVPSRTGRTGFAGRKPRGEKGGGESRVPFPGTGRAGGSRFPPAGRPEGGKPPPRAGRPRKTREKKRKGNNNKKQIKNTYTYTLTFSRKEKGIICPTIICPTIMWPRLVAERAGTGGEQGRENAAPDETRESVGQRRTRRVPAGRGRAAAVPGFGGTAALSDFSESS